MSNRFLQRLWHYAGAVSIRVKVLGIVVGVIVLLGVVVSVQMRSVLTTVLTRNLLVQTVALSETIAADAGALVVDSPPNQDALDLLVLERQAHFSSASHNTAISYVAVEEAGGAPVAEAGVVPDRPVSPSTAPYPDFSNVFPIADRPLLEIQSPVNGGDYLVRMGVSLVDINRTVREVLLQLLATTLVMVAVGFAAAFFLTWILTRPILDLVDAAHAVARGDFSRRLPRWADDEIGELTTAFNGMSAALARADQERQERERLREAYISGVILAQENERRRIARELHDSTSQSLTSLLVGMQNLKQTPRREVVAQRLEDLRSLVADTLDEIRNISWRLRPSALDDLGLVSALTQYVHDYQKRHDIPVEMVIRGLEGHRLPPEMETTVYRIVQEGLTNIARYAGASTVSLILTRRDGTLRLIIEDDGRGFDPARVQTNRKSLGLQGIRERAGLFEGELTIETAPGQGTTLFVEIPLSGEVAYE